MLDTAQIEDAFSLLNDRTNALFNILNLNLQYEENQKSIINVINKSLTNSKQCHEGLEFLDLLMQNFSVSVIQANALNWVNHCLIKYSDDVLRELRLRVLGKIVELEHTESDFNKSFASEYLSKVFESCISTLNINTYECATAIKTLSICMKCYPNWFGIHRDKIETFLIQFLDSPCDILVLNAAMAFHILQQTGPEGANKINYKRHFSENFSKLCRTAHFLFDIWFRNETELYTIENSNEEVFEFHNDSKQSVKAELDITARRICNVLVFIKIMIKTSFPAAKETKPRDILYVIRRGLTFHNCITDTEKQSLITNHSAVLLHQIQISLLNILRFTIIWYQANILPFSYTISKMLIDIIEMFHKCDCFKLNSLYQESTYKTLHEWFPIVKSSFHPQFQSQLLACIMKDITPVKARMTLTISDGETGKKSQKAKRRAVADRIISSNKKGLKTEPSTLRAKYCHLNTTKLALKTLKQLLLYTKISVKESEIQDLYTSLFSSLNGIQQSKLIHPYTDPNCQAHIYDVLVSLFRQNTLNPLPPLHTSLDILNRGLNSKNKHIADICKSGIANLEILCQPICPSLYFGIASDDKKNIVSEENIDDDENMDFDYYHEERIESFYDHSAMRDESAMKDVPAKDISNNKCDDKNTDMPYEVNQPESEHSFVEENLSDKNPNAVSFEELALGTNTGDNTQHKPRVTAPSEDGNEVLEEGDHINDETKTEKENQESGVDETVTKEGKIDENAEAVRTDETNLNHTEATDDNDKLLDISSGTVLDQSMEENDDNFEEGSLYSGEAAVKRANLDEDDDDDKDLGDKFEENFEGGSETKIHPDEPVAKRAKIQDEEDLGDTFVEKCEDQDNLDASFLQEDSFVDEVKDY